MVTPKHERDLAKLAAAIVRDECRKRFDRLPNNIDEAWDVLNDLWYLKRDEAITKFVDTLAGQPFWQRNFWRYIRSTPTR